MMTRYVRTIKKFLAAGLIAALLCNPLPVTSLAVEDKLSTETNEYDPVVVVSMGDSYSSGEGIEPFYGQYDNGGAKIPASEKVKNLDWLAHRSEKSWGGQLNINGYNLKDYKVDTDLEGKLTNYKENQPAYWFFVASSGAVTNNIYPNKNKEIHQQYKQYNKDGISGDQIMPAQLDIFDQIDKTLGPNSVDYVTFTFGGNDVGFTDIITTASTHTSFHSGSIKHPSLLGLVIDHSAYLCPNELSASLNNTWDKFYQKDNDGIRNKIATAYRNIAKQAPKSAIIVAGYPKLITESHSDLFKDVVFNDKEVASINSSVSRFNMELDRLVSECQEDNLNIHFVPVEEKFAGHEAYSKDAWINPVIFKSRAEDLNDYVISSAYSMHPNIKGAEAYAECIQSEINNIESAKTQNNAIDTKGKEKGVIGRQTASEREINMKALHYNGVVVRPEDVVLKAYDAIKEDRVEDTLDCMEPTAATQYKIIGGIATFIGSAMNGEYTSFFSSIYTDEDRSFDVIDCYCTDMKLKSDFDLLNILVPRIPIARDLACVEATVNAKLRYKNADGTYSIQTDTYKVKKYDRYGWRIMVEQ